VDDDTRADAALTRRLADGHRTALADAFDRFAPTLTRYAWAQAERRQDVEELVQDTFLTLWQKAATIDLATSALLPWLLVVCRNHARNQARRLAKGAGDELPEDLPARAGLVGVRAGACAGSATRSPPSPPSTDGSANSASSKATPTPKPHRSSASASAPSPNASPDPAPD
jgi:DNA-directed RNA polymerase specialized sigma24 family protein